MGTQSSTGDAAEDPVTQSSTGDAAEDPVTQSSTGDLATQQYHAALKAVAWTFWGMLSQYYLWTWHSSYFPISEKLLSNLALLLVLVAMVLFASGALTMSSKLLVLLS